MKFNLKNRPSDDSALFVALDYYIEKGYIKTENLPLVLDLDFRSLLKEAESNRKKRLEWFEGFEKELRERILDFPESCQKCKNYNQQKMECRLLACPYIEEATEIFREILEDEWK